jgi:hypothetical protein
MKPLLVFFAILVFSLSAQAQLDKNTWLVGGSGNFNSSKRNYVSYTMPTTNGYSKDVTFSLFPNIGYFISDKFAVGLKTLFSWSKGEFFPDDPAWSGGKTTSTKFSIGPFARYYFLDMTKQYNVLSEVSYQGGTWNSVGTKGALRSFNASVGPVIFFNSSVGLEMLFGYSANSENFKGSYKNSPKGFNVNIGFQIHLLK